MSKPKLVRYKPKWASKDIYIREGSYDKAICSEIPRCYGWMPLVGLRVLDVGVCFGAFSLWAVEHQALKVRGYEPELRNYQLATYNVPQAEIVRAALTSRDDKTLTLYTTRGANYGNFSTTHFRGRDRVEVPALNFQKVLEEYKPEAIKMDCEGSEYELLSKPLPSFIKHIALEIHFTKKEWVATAPSLIEQFSAWRCQIEPSLKPGLWHTIGGWSR